MTYLQRRAYPPGVEPPPPAPLGFETTEWVLGPGTNFLRFNQCIDCGSLVADPGAHRRFHDKVNRRLAIAEVHIAEWRAREKK